MEKEIKRLKDTLASLDPTSSGYRQVLINLATCYELQERFESHKENPVATVQPVAEEAPAPVEEEPTPVAEPIPEKPAKTKTKEKPKEEPKAPEVKPEPMVSIATLNKEDVRALLSTASKAGVIIKDIIAKYVPEGKAVKFSEVPTSLYPNLVKEIKQCQIDIPF